ncbi:hypothetical protein P153DRAFT_287451 [Dothidotthia symphoricarpi CBS 119687]|uniref:Uncharacterized protein n=1 Tax=Dothidotthia symphoricarpi CBS 119687 TaxID=1392245 RepID=A0A6A6AGU5_9PLEO|nr:uncharacterized protein P153DRAFT_287451 [Dothidotthia symphoricarpi CBS 119687]KAF2131159.1 hypothetical protein P153DRAFT_287451 [Dothidotthia symphoricarpi CBS 119687]
MFSCRSVFHLRTFLSASLLAHALAVPDNLIVEIKEDVKAHAEYATALTGGEGCSFSNLEDIRSGFAEMTSLFLAAIPYDPNDQPAVEFFGYTPTRRNYSTMVGENLQRAAQYANVVGGPGTPNSDIHVRCDDPIDICQIGNPRDGRHTAYNIGNDPHINFCQDYFDLDELDEKVDKKANNQAEREILHNYYNRATLWARMVMHFSEIGHAIVAKPIPAPANSPKEWLLSVSQGPMNTSVLAGVLNECPGGRDPNNMQTLKYAYGVVRSKILAVLSVQMPYDAANNAENYALYAQARYIIKKKGFYPNMPIMDFPNEETVITNEQLQDGERVKHAFFDAPDVVERPADMEVKGQPLPSSASTVFGTCSTWMGLTIFVIAHACVQSSFG